jgi:hypothetical protein
MFGRHQQITLRVFSFATVRFTFQRATAEKKKHQGSPALPK